MARRPSGGERAREGDQALHGVFEDPREGTVRRASQGARRVPNESAQSADDQRPEEVGSGRKATSDPQASPDDGEKAAAQNQGRVRPNPSGSSHRTRSLSYAAGFSTCSRRRIWLTVSASSIDANTGRKLSEPSSPKAPLGARARACGPSSTRKTSCSRLDGASMTYTMRERSSESSSSPRRMRTRLSVTK